MKSAVEIGKTLIKNTNNLVLAWQSCSIPGVIVNKAVVSDQTQKNFSNQYFKKLDRADFFNDWDHRIKWKEI